MPVRSAAIFCPRCRNEWENHVETIKSGIFIMPFHPPGKPLAQSHDEDMELALAAEEFGFDEFWVGEHHSMAWEPIVSPEMFISAVFRQTERMRLGPAPVLLNLHHPAQVAHRLAFLDHFSHGRLNLAFGYGASPSDFTMYDQTPDQSLVTFTPGGVWYAGWHPGRFTLDLEWHSSFVPYALSDEQQAFFTRHVLLSFGLRW